MRGENTKSRSTSSRHLGSSPRAWGKPRRGGEEAGQNRIIPTCVGKTLAIESFITAPPDHPHVRGENLSTLSSNANRFGSSPRAWGKRTKHGKSKKNLRIIPTCVGKTRARVGSPRTFRDHPHVRGENVSATARQGKLLGSSPRAWGKPSKGWESMSAYRIIPTCVGKTSRAFCWVGVGADHPHVRGENLPMRAETVSHPGSSPRAWGKLRSLCTCRSLRRIIPTCVGKTLRGSQESSWFSDHPHVRGENKIHAITSLASAGSSPRAWGKPLPPLARYALMRIIPTCVGKTTRWAINGVYISDHPHVRGENITPPDFVAGYAGSSPRAWGKPAEGSRRARSGRIIPTCVGKTT